MANRLELPNQQNQQTPPGRHRPTASVIQRLGTSTSGTPHTPSFLRSQSSLYGSPSSSFRTEDETIVLEIGSRYLRSGFGGESSPRCVLDFSPNRQRRVGDYRQWTTTAEEGDRARVGSRKGRIARDRKREGWGKSEELWPLDIRDADLQDVGDKLGRAMREARSKYFLTDSRAKKVVVVVDWSLPRPLMWRLLMTAFASFHSSRIALVSSPLACTFGAGLRSALVIDLGWAESRVTAVYEYREVAERRTTRAGKLLTETLAGVLEEAARAQKGEDEREVGLEVAEEVLVRRGWCFDRRTAIRGPTGATGGNSCKDTDDAGRNREYDEALRDRDVTVSLNEQGNGDEVPVKFGRLGEATERALFGRDDGEGEGEGDDDDEVAVPMLAYQLLRALPVDVRGKCASRIIVTGGLSKIAGLKGRMVEEIAGLVERGGWGRVKRWGSSSAAAAAATATAAAGAREDTVAAADGRVQGWESVGSWAGGSLVAGLRLGLAVELERDLFLKHEDPQWCSLA